ncbi:MAG TPA: methyltransferase domain-containing protein, partial [Myxococcaceae bacterium]|nr:methyltransferase domain-containing protein [Myxococcaceae bacterium]
DVTRDLASQVGRTGQVVGLDLSESMVEEARKRTEGTGLPVEFHVGDIHRMDFPDASFDGTRASRVFIYVERPLEALSEMLRITRPGGSVVLFEPELDSWVLDGPDRNVVRRLIHFWTDQLRNPWAARRLPGQLRTLGVTEILANPVAGPWTMGALEIFGLRPVTDRAVQEGVATRAEVDEWLHFLEASHRTGRFFGASMGVVIRGIKPAT